MRTIGLALILLTACADTTAPVGPDAGCPAPEAPRVIAWREVECARLCTPDLALCIGAADPGRCAYQCAHMAPAGDYCPLFTPQF